MQMRTGEKEKREEKGWKEREREKTNEENV